MSVIYNFTGHKILITGAGKGIGREIVKALYKFQADDIFAVTRTASDLDTLAAECATEFPNSKTQLHLVTLDLAQDLDSISKILTPIFEKHQINHLINNAGANILENFSDLQEKSFDFVMQINLKVPVFLSQMFVKSLELKREQNQQNLASMSSILNISSQASVVPLMDHTAYCVSKAGLDMATKMMALEKSKKLNLKINNINPTVVLTELGKNAWSDPVKADPMKIKIPIDRFAEVEDVVGSVLYLLSDGSQMLNAGNIYVDGGFVGCN